LTPHDPQPTAPVEAPGHSALPAAIALLFFLIAFNQAQWKLLWGDEFITYWIGQQRSFHGIWNALASGADPNPPLMHIMNWGSTALLGSNSFAIRLPSILGMALGLASLWLFLRRRFAPVYAAAGCLALMTTRAFDYTYDARSYSLLMGFAMAALLCWSIALHATGWRRSLALLGLTAALACGISSNYYAAVAFLPIAAGELHASIAHRRARPGVWIAMAVAATPLIAFARLIRHNLAEFAPHAWNKPHISMISDSYLVIVEGILWPVLGLALFAWWRSRRIPASTRTRTEVSPEATAVYVLISYPLLAFLVGLATSGMVSPRCAAPVCFGIVIAGVALLARHASPKAAAFVVAFLVIWVLARQAACGYVLLQQRHAFLHLRRDVEGIAAPGEPILVGDSLVALALHFYSSPLVRDQIAFPVDFDAIHRTEHDDSGEQNLWGGRNGVFPIHIASPATLLPPHEECILVGPPAGWLANDLRARGYDLREIPTAVPWNHLGGIFTPLAHEQTRLFLAVPAQPVP
jgi:hypothetical protein